MRFSSSLSAFALASLVAAAPLARRSVINEINHDIQYNPGAFPSYPGANFPGGHGSGFPGNGFPGSGLPGNGGPGGNNGNNGGNGSNGSGNNGNGGNGNNGNGGNGNNGNGGSGNNGSGGSGNNGSGGSGNNGSGGSGNNGSGGSGNNGSGSNGGGSGDKNGCGITSGQISALTPLLDKLGLSTTVDGVKQLVKNLLSSVDGLLESPGVNGSGGLVDLVNNVVKGLLGQPLDLHNTVDALTSILKNQVPCLLDTVLPKP